MLNVNIENIGTVGEAVPVDVILVVKRSMPHKTSLEPRQTETWKRVSMKYASRNKALLYKAFPALQLTEKPTVFDHFFSLKLGMNFKRKNNKGT